jgi:hypothetical protein
MWFILGLGAVHLGVHLCCTVCHRARVHILGSGGFTCAALCVTASVCAHVGFGGVHFSLVPRCVSQRACVHILGSGEFIFHLCRAVCHSERVCTFLSSGEFTCAAVCVIATGFHYSSGGRIMSA